MTQQDGDGEAWGEAWDRRLAESAWALASAPDPEAVGDGSSGAWVTCGLGVPSGPGVVADADGEGLADDEGLGDADGLGLGLPGLDPGEGEHDGDGVACSPRLPWWPPDAAG